MLLRSSSTPGLDSLLPPVFQSEAFPLRESSKNESLISPEIAKSLSFSSSSSSCRSLTSPLHQNIVCVEPFSAEEVHWDTDGEVVLRRARVRRAQSEDDLQSLSLGSFAPAKLAAKSLLSNGKLSSGQNEDDTSGSAKKSWPRPSNLRRGRSGTFSPSVCLGAFGLDREDFIPEEEADTKIESGCFDDASTTLDKSCLFCEDQLGSAHHEIRTESPAAGIVLQVKNGEVSVKQRVLRLPKYVMSDVKISETSLSDEGDKAVFSGRVEQMTTLRGSAQLSDGEYYSSSSVGVNGAVSVVCNSQECRPLHIDEQSKLLGNGGGIDVGDSISGGRGRSGRRSLATSSGGGSGADADVTDLYYQKMLLENPGNPLFLRNYSQFLAEVKRDFSKAEEYYARAILANPGDGEMLAQYAKIIWEVHQDAERAASYFERAVQAAPDDSYVMAAHASFLWNSEEKEEEQQAGGLATPLPSLPSLVSADPAY